MHGKHSVADGPPGQRLVGHGLQFLRGKSGLGLHGNPVRGGHQPGGQHGRVGTGRQVALGTGLLETAAQAFLALCTHLHQQLPHRFGIVGSGQRTVEEQTASLVIETGVQGHRLRQPFPGHLACRLQALGVRAQAFRSDQAVPGSAPALMDTVMAHFGRLDILIHNAAVAVQGARVDDPGVDAAGLDHLWRTNVHGPLALTRAAAPLLPQGARILFIGSGFGTRVAFAGVVDYAATKAALVGYARGAARDPGPRGITVNVLQPGIMPTAMAGPLASDPPKALLDLHTITRIATLEEVAAMAAHLVGPQAGYISGTVVEVSGGYTA